MATYERMDVAKLGKHDNHGLFQSVADHLTLVGGRYEALQEVERIEGIPEAAIVAWCAWWFSAEVGGNGVADFVMNHCPSTYECTAIHSALKAVGADELAELLEAAIAFTSEDGSGQFLEFPDAEWFKQFRRRPELGDFRDLQARSMELAAEPLSALVAAFIRTRRHEL